MPDERQKLSTAAKRLSGLPQQLQESDRCLSQPLQSSHKRTPMRSTVGLLMMLLLLMMGMRMIGKGDMILIVIRRMS